MTLLPAITDAPPPAHCDPLAGLDPEERHRIWLSVAAMGHDLKTTRDRLAAAEALIARQRRRIALQHETIMREHRKAGTDPAPVLAAISDALGETPAAVEPVKATPLPHGTVLGAVRADRAGLKAAPLPPPGARADARPHARGGAPQVPGDGVECVGVGCDCGLCDPGLRRPESKSAPSRAWWLRQMLAALCGTFAVVGLVIGVLFLATGEYASAVWTLVAAAVSAVVGVVLRPRITPTRGGGR